MSFFVDTNLCGKVRTEPSLQEKWAKARERFEKQGQQYVVSPLVLIELLLGLARPEPAFFKRDLDRLHFFAGGDSPDFLEFPGEFVLKTVLNSRSPVTKLTKRDFGQWLAVALNAETRDALVQGRVKMYTSKLLSFGLDLTIMERQRDELLKSHIDAWEERNRLNLPPPTREQWAYTLLYSLGIIPQSEDLTRIAASLDAAYEYDLFLYRAMAHYNFGSIRNRGDRTDLEMLYYLCDPEMHLVTGDARFKKRIASSPQAGRIHLINDF